MMDLLSPDDAAPHRIASEQAALRSAMDAFLQSVERRALFMLELGTRHREEALDLLQDCMLRFVRRYSLHPASEWPPLFYRVVNNSLIDWQRRRTVRERVLAIWPWHGRGADAEALDPPDTPSAGPDEVLDRTLSIQTLERAVRALPLRQRQVFLLREWQGLDVAQTARALEISAGSVKTHLSRANAKLREALSVQA